MAACLDDGIDHFALLFLQFVDAFLDRAGRNHTDDLDDFFLAETVHTVGSLAFDGWVPPRVVEDNRISASQIQSGPPGFQGNQEKILLALVEASRQAQTILIRGLAIEVKISFACRIQLLTDDGQHLRELGEQDNASAVLFGLRQILHQPVQFARTAFVIGHDQGRIATNLAQARQSCQYFDPVLVQRIRVQHRFGFLAHQLQLGQVRCLLFFGHFDVGDRFDLRRQILQHVSLQPAQDEWFYFFGDLCRFHFLKIRSRPEKAGLCDAENGVQFGQSIFDRRSAQSDFVVGSERGSGFCRLRCGVLDTLGFIQDDGPESQPSIEILITLQQRIGGDPDRNIFGDCSVYAVTSFTLRPGDELRLDTWRELFEFLLPIVEHAGRTDDQIRFGVAFPERTSDETDDL